MLGEDYRSLNYASMFTFFEQASHHATLFILHHQSRSILEKNITLLSIFKMLTKIIKILTIHSENN